MERLTSNNKKLKFKSAKKSVTKILTKKSPDKSIKNNKENSTDTVSTNKEQIVVTPVKVNNPFKQKANVDKKQRLKNITLSLTKTIIYFIIIIGLGLTIGIYPFTKVNNEGFKGSVEGSGNSNCKYSEWRSEQVTYCLVSSDGKFYEGQLIKYEKTDKPNQCIKYTRRLVCS